MKNIISLFMMAFLVIGTLGFVVAEDSDVVPVAKKIGFFENSLDRIKLAFTFNKEVRIERTLDMAEKRLAEAELLAEENPEAYDLAQERYDNLIARAEEDLAAIESGDDAETSEEDLAMIARIQNRFELHNDVADEIYIRARERFEMNNASDEKLERFEMFYERTSERNALMQGKVIAKREAAIEMHKEMSNMSDEELATFLEEVEERQGLTADREVRQDKLDVRVQKATEIKRAVVEKARASLIDSGLSVQERLQAKERILEETQAMENLRLRAEASIKNELGGNNA